MLWGADGGAVVLKDAAGISKWQEYRVCTKDFVLSHDDDLCFENEISV